MTISLPRLNFGLGYRTALSRFALIFIVIVILAASILVGYLAVKKLPIQSEITVTCSGNGCPGFGQDYLMFVNYSDDWALSYRAYLQSGMSTDQLFTFR